MYSKDSLKQKKFQIMLNENSKIKQIKKAVNKAELKVLRIEIQTIM